MTNSNYQVSPGCATSSAGYYEMSRWYLEKTNIDTQSEMALINARAMAKIAVENANYVNSLHLIQYKEEVDQRKLDKIESNRMLREMAVESVVLDSLGFIRLLRTFPNGKEVLSSPVLNISNLAVKRLWAYGSALSLLSISWIGKENGKTELVVQADISSKQLLKKMKSRGIMFMVPRDSEKVVRELILAFINDCAVAMEIPREYGWNLLSDGTWFFCSDVSESLEGRAEHVL